QSVIVDLDQITIHALYCDRLDLPDNYFELLDQSASKGGYFLTHVLLAIVWIEENDCNFEYPEGFKEKIFQYNAALINNDSIVTDLELEAASFLFLAGQGSLVKDDFINLVFLNQKNDGSWGQPGQEWHTTILGLLLSLHIKYPAQNYPPTIAPQ
ncbi:hypothetical protein KJN74_04605, partial [Candidatus Bathyarchaeota archaeon]|nr:hypothetical protein [Candidatus Bathyarchaeota archaeon]